MYARAFDTVLKWFLSIYVVTFLVVTKLRVIAHSWRNAFSTIFNTCAYGSSLLVTSPFYLIIGTSWWVAVEECNSSVAGFIRQLPGQGLFFTLCRSSVGCKHYSADSQVNLPSFLDTCQSLISRSLMLMSLIEGILRLDVLQFIVLLLYWNLWNLWNLKLIFTQEWIIYCRVCMLNVVLRLVSEIDGTTSLMVFISSGW